MCKTLYGVTNQCEGILIGSSRVWTLLQLNYEWVYYGQEVKDIFRHPLSHVKEPLIAISVDAYQQFKIWKLDYVLSLYAYLNCDSLNVT